MTKSKNPLVSVIIPIYNGAQHLHQSVQSVFDQTYDNIELIIIDDGSTDNSGELARTSQKELNQYNGIKVRVFTNKRNEGIGYTRNRGVKLAKGKYICFLSCDDRYHNNFIETHLKHYIPGSFNFSNYNIINEFNTVTYQFQYVMPDDYNDFIMQVYMCALDYNMFINYDTIFADAPTFKKHNIMPEYRMGEDYEHILRLILKPLFENNVGVPFNHIAEPLVDYKVHSKSTTTIRRRDIIRNDKNIMIKLFGSDTIC